MSNSPLLSVIIPVYNVEKYLAETLDSVIAQDIGFEKNIEIILVNDGSTDKSEEICKKYQQQYPKNITYIKQKNAGVSAARNKGIEAAKGRYLSFLDSDDKYSYDTAREVCDFFERHYEEVDVVAIKLVFFDAKSGDHMLNFKFSETRVIDIQKEPECVQLSGGSSFVKSESVKGRHSFDVRLKFAEDARFLNELILAKGAYGVVSGPTLYYRKLSNATSALANSITDKSYYLDTPRYFSEYFISWSKKASNSVTKYIQHLVMYDLQWRLNQQSQEVLSKSEEASYKKTVYKLIEQIDDDVIVAQRWLPLERKIFALKKKYGSSYEKHIKIDHGRVFINDTLIWDYAKRTQKLNIDFIHAQTDNTLKIEGYVVNPATNKLNVKLLVNGNKQDIRVVERNHMKQQTFLGDVIKTGIGFEAIVSTAQKTYIGGVLSDDNETDITMPLNLRTHTRVGNVHRSYRKVGEFLVTNLKENYLKIDRYSFFKHLSSEVIFALVILASALMGSTDARHLKSLIRQLRKKGIPKYVKGLLLSVGLLAVRLWVMVARRLKRKEIWIVSDRPTAAGDNGEALFEYIQTQKNKGIKVYFALSERSSDYKRLKKIGPVLKWGSYRYKLLFMLADKVVSSHLDSFITNPYHSNAEIFMNLLKFKFVFLNHGINKDDMSFWMNRFDQDMSLFIVAGIPEYDSIINGNYYYPSEKVLLSGFPRYDKLVSEPKGKVIIAPTWRKYIANEHDITTGDREYDNNFINTKYFEFYNQLLCDERLLRKLKEQGMTAEFYLHPAHRTQLKDFKGNDTVKIMQYPYDYANAFKQGSVLLTDYSSVAFDFAYMKKPIIYAQFDEEEFFGKHWVRGYFSYDNNGMGPVVRDYESTVRELVKIIENNCKMEEKYKKRVDEFFAFTDKNNSARVYEAILDMPK